MNNRIGFRVKIELNSSDFNSLGLEKNLFEFFGNYDLMELKLSNKLINDISFCKILNVFNKTTDSGISFHLPSDILFGLEVNENYKNLLNNLKRIQFNDNTRLITHCPKINDGYLNVNQLIEFLRKNNINAPIILEVTLNNVFKEGYEQIKLLK
ncbi:hypothetical protein [Clostridium amazonitimonense]|uniref:hypothetical protein n=1 Tax=Clostridium amazonitimonense TaxID=1499689 RepID=UPI000509531C|nr:hypothetical protein [Clostridium amazonitimonense]